MITEIVIFDVPEGMGREEVLANYRRSAPGWRLNPDLIRKNYLYDAANRKAGGVYLWRGLAAAQRARNTTWLERVRRTYGCEPVVQYFATPLVVIMGGGLAGLIAARALDRAGIPFLLLEARSRLGGRILSVDAAGEASMDGFDLGPSWFWPAVQPVMARLVDDLGLARFPQYGVGDVVLQRTSREPAQRFAGMCQEPQSMRFTGGAGALVTALASELPPSRIQCDARVTQVTLDTQAITLDVIDDADRERRIVATHVVCALPPRLLEATVSFSPPLDPATAQRWRRTSTWMAPHAKLFAIYDTPFWRSAGLSGMARSMAGPLVEIHDATTASGQAALFGFLGIPAQYRVEAGHDALIAASVRQLVQLFGPRAATPRATLLKDWAADPLTATDDDGQAGSHLVPSVQDWVGGEWRNRLWLAGSKTSRSEPGYLAGAVEAAERTVAEIIERLICAPESALSVVPMS
jgi:monoamine oxidase